jgi:hypothetical protein
MSHKTLINSGPTLPVVEYILHSIYCTNNMADIVLTSTVPKCIYWHIIFWPFCPSSLFFFLNSHPKIEELHSVEAPHFNGYFAPEKLSSDICYHIVLVCPICNMNRSYMQHTFQWLCSLLSFIVIMHCNTAFNLYLIESTE